MRRLSNLSDAEMVALKSAYSTIKHQMQTGETCWADHLATWDQFQRNADATAAMFADKHFMSESDHQDRRAENPALYDLIMTTLVNI